MIKKYSTIEVRKRSVQAVKHGHSVSSVADMYQVHRSTVYRWLERYEEDEGYESLKRKEGSGRRRALNVKDTYRLKEIVLCPASQFGYETDLWTSRRLIQIIKEHLGVTLSQPTMWRMLRGCDLTYQKPERRYMEASETARLEWIETELPKIKETVRKYRAVLYFEDEASISLTALLGKTWAPKGKPPVVVVTGKRDSIAAISAITQSGRLVFALHENRIASKEIIHFLQQLLNHHPRRNLVVVMDQAPPHTSKKTQSFIDKQKRLHVFYLPPYSPDFNPDEKVWNHLKHQKLKSHNAKTKKELKTLTCRKLRSMSKNSHLVRGIFFRCCVADLMN